MTYCSICDERYEYYTRFTKTKDTPNGLKEVELITAHARCRNLVKKENERKLYENEIQLKILNLEYEIFLLKEKLIDS